MFVEKELLRQTNKHPVSNSLWENATSYIPNLLLKSLANRGDYTQPFIERVHGSLVLADISGFTAMTEKLAESGNEGAEWLTDIVNKYFQRMLDIARAHGGTHIKFGGDALLLIFQGENNAAFAVTSALKMQNATKRFSSFHAGGSRFRLRMTVGVHTATFYSVVAGIAHEAMHHFILGEETNNLAKLQGLASPGELIISDDTMSGLGIPCEYEPRVPNYKITRILKSKPLPKISNNILIPEGLDVTSITPYLPAPIASSMREGHEHMQIEGEHRKITVVFINLLGINRLIQSDGPDEFLNQFQVFITTLLSLCQHYNGLLIGNDVAQQGLKLILVFGAPIAHENDTANALRLTLDLNRAIKVRRLGFSTHIGIHSDFAFVGDVGSAYSRQYTVMGDTVNLAARLMASSSAEQILISKKTAEDSNSICETPALSPITVKGKKNSIPICELKSERVPSAYPETEQKRTFYGREKEIISFNNLCSEILEGNKKHILLIQGQAGVGKTELLEQFKKSLKENEWNIVTTASYAHTGKKPFSIWIDILYSFFNIGPSDEKSVNNSKVISAIRELIPEMSEYASILNNILDLSLPEPQMLHNISGEDFHRYLFEILKGIISAKSSIAPLALFIENLQWADLSSISLINQVAGYQENAPILLCISTRPQEKSPFTSPHDFSSTINLGELCEEDSINLVKEVCGQSTIHSDILTAIISKAKGNPLFLKEIALSLKQSGILNQVASEFAPDLQHTIHTGNLPDRVQNLIMSRIDALGSYAKEILRTAAVIGDSFELPTLLNIGSFTEDTIGLEEYLSEIEKSELLYKEHEIGKTVYRFPNTLVQEVAYESLLFAKRRQLHYNIGTYIEQKYDAKVESPFETLFYHYSRSDDTDKTRYYSVKAGDKARQVFACNEAIAYYESGLATLHGSKNEVLVYQSYFMERIGDCRDLLGQHHEAASIFSQSLKKWQKGFAQLNNIDFINHDLRENIPSRIRIPTLYQKIAVSLDRCAIYNSALKRINDAQKSLPGRSSIHASKIYITKSLILFHTGNYREAIYWGYRGLSIARRMKDNQSIANGYNIIANSYTAVGNLKQAILYRKHAIKLYDDMGDFVGQATANNNIGVSYQYLGNLNMAIASFNRSLEAAQRAKHLTYIAIAYNNIGEILYTKGHYEESITNLEYVINNYDVHQQTALCGLAYVNLSRNYLQLRNYQQAFNCLKRGEEMLKKTGAKGLVVEALLQSSELMLVTEKIESAKQIAEEALNNSAELGMKLHEARALLLLGKIHYKRESWDEAQNFIERSLSMAEAIKADYEQGEALLWLARLHANCQMTPDSYRRCSQFLKKSALIFKRIGADQEIINTDELQIKIKNMHNILDPE